MRPIHLVFIAALFTGTACVDPTPQTATPTVGYGKGAFSISGTVAGLTGTVTLQQGNDALAVTAPQTTFTFPTTLHTAQSWRVSVAHQPHNQTCAFNADSGSIDNANVALQLTCVDALRTLTVAVWGSTGPLVMLNNGSETLSSPQDGSYTFPTALNDGSIFNVTVANQPTSQACTVANGYGMLDGSNPSDITVHCISPTAAYSIGGVVVGLSGTVVLNNAGIEDIALTQAGSFTFPTPLLAGALYNVTVVSQPNGQVCALQSTSGATPSDIISGTVHSAITTLRLNCTPGYTIGGTLTNASGTLRLLNNANANDVVTTASNGSFAFGITLSPNTPYAVSVLTEPASQTCTVAATGRGITPNYDVTQVGVTCTNTPAASFAVGGTATGLTGSVTLLNAGFDALTVTQNGNFIFPTPLVYGAPYGAVITAQAGEQVCTVLAAAGTISDHNVTNMALNCAAGQNIIVPVTGLTGTLTIQNSIGTTAVISGNGNAFMPGLFLLNSPVTLKVSSAPPHQGCILLNGAGTLLSTLAPKVMCGPFYVFVNGQNASAVVGQDTFLTSSCTTGDQSVNASRVCQPYGDPWLSPSGALWLVDCDNNRVLAFDAVPTGAGASADLVVGQTSFTGSGAQATATGLSQPTGATGDANYLVIADSNNSRVLLYPLPIETSHPSAAVVVGQTNLNGLAAACSSTGLNQPKSAIIVNGKLIIADTGNNRVLIYNSIPTAHGAAADVALGQNTFTDCASGSGATASSLAHPTDVHSDGQSLWVADAYNNRVLNWTTLPSVSATPASQAIGQLSFTASVAGTDAKSLSTPSAIAANGTQLFIADSGNHRVLIFNSLPLLLNNNYFGVAADVVLGQPNMTDALCNGPGAIVGAETLCTPSGLSINGNSLIVGDTANNRYLIYTGY